jgi:hypothetical protein
MSSNTAIAAIAPVISATPVGGTSSNAVGVTELDTEAEPAPTLFVALTVNVYAVSLVKSVTIIGLAAPVAVILPGCAVTV